MTLWIMSIYFFSRDNFGSLPFMILVDPGYSVTRRVRPNKMWYRPYSTRFYSAFNPQSIMNILLFFSFLFHIVGQRQTELLFVPRVVLFPRSHQWKGGGVFFLCQSQIQGRKHHPLSVQFMIKLMRAIEQVLAILERALPFFC